jgi:Zn-dependent protease
VTFTPATVGFIILTVITAVVLHELMHGVVALWLGDPTARDAGRLTLNPIRHVDPFGTLLLPGLLIALSLAGVGGGTVFGYAKPVPIDAGRLRNSRHRLLLVSLAGPLTNLILGVLALLVFRLAMPVPGPLAIRLFVIWVTTNLFLAFLNLFPVPPLDGSEVVAWFLPERARRAFRSAAPVGWIVVLGLVFLFPSIVFGWIDGATVWVFRAVLQ